jgi:hypothetical protein
MRTRNTYAELDLAGAKVVPAPGRGRGTVRINALGATPKPGAVIYKSALLQVAIVDKAGQRPRPGNGRARIRRIP